MPHVFRKLSDPGATSSSEHLHWMGRSVQWFARHPTRCRFHRTGAWKNHLSLSRPAGTTMRHQGVTFKDFSLAGSNASEYVAAAARCEERSRLPLSVGAFHLVSETH